MLGNLPGWKCCSNTKKYAHQKILSTIFVFEHHENTFYAYVSKIFAYGVVWLGHYVKGLKWFVLKSVKDTSLKIKFEL